MRRGFVIALLTTVFFVSGYFYYTALAICDIPIAYRIGTIDDRFKLTSDEAKLVAAEAESVWEDATGKNLFTYEDDAKFTINFTYDERQAFTDAEAEYRGELDNVKETSTELTQQYEELSENYKELKTRYQQDVSIYEADLQKYNETVEEYNSQGGAPPAAYEQLEEDRAALNAVRRDLDDVAETLNEMVDRLNAIGNQGNELVEEYNDRVGTYNNTFGSHREFTQGTYTNTGAIDIYTFADIDELRLVLAHEFGHALSIGHVENETSIMYFLIGKQSVPLTLTETDMAAFSAVCGNHSFWDTIILGFNSLYK